MAKRDFYEVLGVSKGASQDDIKKAYRKVAMQHHPDRNPGDKAAEEKFKEAAEAYEILSDDQKRAKYDRLGHQAFEQGGGGGGFQGGFSAEDIFNQFFGGQRGGGGSPFDDFFGGGRSTGPRGGQQGSNLRIKVKMTLSEIATGVQKTIKVKKEQTCTVCNGTGAKDKNSMTTCHTCKGAGQVRKVTSTFLGQMQTTVACPTCHGRGQIVKDKCSPCKGNGTVIGEETITIDIPAGVYNDIQLSMQGKGNAGKFGGPNGDLMISIEELPHEHLQRDGNNVIHELFISFVDAAIGTEVKVPTIDGTATIKIEPGSQSGKVLRLKGKGLPELQGYGNKGDQLIRVNVWVPKQLTKEEVNLLEKLRSMPNFNPNPTKQERNFFDKMKDFLQ